MSFLTGFIFFIFVINCIFLILIVIPQKEGSGGDLFGTSTAQFGSRNGNIISTLTTVFGISFFALSLLLAFLNKTDAGEDGVLQAVRDINGQEMYKWWEVSETETTVEEPILEETITIEEPTEAVTLEGEIEGEVTEETTETATETTTEETTDEETPATEGETAPATESTTTN